MSGLSAFFLENAVLVKNEKYAVSMRFLNEFDTPQLWEIRCITAQEDEALRLECTRRVPVPGKYGQYTAETDRELYLGKLLVACTVYPNLHDAQLQNSYRSE